MDIARPESVVRKKKMKRAADWIVGLTFVLLVTVFVPRLNPTPSTERGKVWPGTVRRGPMVRQVRGTGTLVPEDIRCITAPAAGRVAKIVLRSGADVKPESIILELSNPELEHAAVEARLQIESAEAQLINRRAELEDELRTRRAADAAVLERKRRRVAEETLKSQLVVQEARVRRLSATYKRRMQELDKLKVRAGLYGVLQTVRIEVGAQIAAGANIAGVADPTRLEAELQMPGTQTKDIEVGQVASVDTRNGIVPGKVSRIDAAATNGIVTVHITLTSELPRGARSDLRVEGTVELERLENVVYMGRPAFSQENSTVTIFKVIPGCDATQTSCEAVRVRVRLGRSSVNTIEILEGLKPGDQVVLSDMSAWDGRDRVRLN